MKRLFKWLLLPLLFVVAVWILVIFWWRVTHRLPDGGDVLLWLVAFPLGLLLGYWLLKKFFDLLKKLIGGLAAGAAAGSGSVAAPVAGDAAASSAERARGFVLHVLGGAVSLPQADSVSGLFDELEDPHFAPKTDPQWQDANGRALIATPVADLDIKAMHAALQALIPQEPAQALTSRLLRSMALLAQVLEKSLKDIEPWQPATEALQVMLVLPVNWPEKHRALAAVWVRQQLLQNHWPKEHIAVSVTASQDEADVLTALDRCNEAFNQHTTAQLGLILAADSSLDEAYLHANSARWFAADNTKGLVPGEGAAALYFKRAEWLLDPAPEVDSVSALHRAAIGRRDKAASAAGHISAELLRELTAQALQVAQVPAAAVPRLVVDVDHRANRLSEVSLLVTKLQGADDNPIAIGRVGAGMGGVGVTATLAALLVAHHAVTKHTKPVLVVAALGEFERGAVVLKPVLLEPAQGAPAA